MNNLPPFEQGVLMALLSLTATLKSTPGFDSEALNESAQYFMANPPPGCDSGEALAAYEWPLSVLKNDAAQLRVLLDADKTRN
ncbi:hypothetical protein [Pseudomonas syringae]|uniref:hypothetical protein n=1 Tax=Pseudomonas syringae TaxID=317 RepID=UPI001F0F1DAB|nr:hypothetical protein [Pseudomonas syringae]MCH5486725.1 hypothetical protein [Pseudomonas syringae pv. syringae]MDO1457701.1 hypothetical protein [Pseudomonas syringae pv. syringae]